MSPVCFFLVCCFDPSCVHPVCRSKQKGLSSWYSGGPLITHLPLLVPDPDRLWDNVDSTECKDTSTGHYWSPQLSLKSQLSPMKTLPSAVLKEKFDYLASYPPTESFCFEIVKETLLSVSEVIMWFEHLHTIENHSRGAAKAAETRRKKEGLPSCYYTHLKLCSMLSGVPRVHRIYRKV